MLLSRFEKAAALAKKFGTWNHNDVALAVKESLESESKNPWVYGVVSTEHDNAQETEEQPKIDHEFDNPMECFHSYVAVNLRPPSEVMICIEKCMSDYLRAGGKLSLDRAFFGKEHVATKSYAKLNYDKSLDSKYAFFDAVKDLSKRKSLEGKAEEFLSTHLDDSLSDVQSFLKGFNRWKSSKNR
jgi:hypothetical protein